MFVNYKLEDIKADKIHLHEEEQKDVIIIIQSLRNESIEINNWKLFEIARDYTDRIYGLENNKKDLFYMKLTSNGKVFPCYFKNHDLNEYSLFEANSILEAIILYDKFYDPKTNLCDSNFEQNIELNNTKNDNKIKYYRLGYDYLFLPQSSFNYKNEYIGAMSINVLFKVYNEDGSEKLFETDEAELLDQAISYRDGEHYLFQLIICSFDKEKIIKFNPNISLFKKKELIDFSFSWEIESYWKDIDIGILEPEKITETEFMDIMKNNKDIFDNIDNQSAQNTTFFTQEVEKSSLTR